MSDDPAHGIHPLARLLRGFAVDFLTCHDAGVVPRIMTPDYRLHIGGVVFDGRDTEYLPATAAQLTQFPGLCVTVHDVILGENACAMRFTEHGASLRDGGRLASWRGITMFRTDGERLQRGWAEEDYLARKRQLATGDVDAVEAPHPAPWDQRPEASDAAAEAAATDWIRNRHPVGDYPQDARPDAPEPPASALIEVRETVIDVLFSAGARVAFHATHQGLYAGGFDDIDSARIGDAATLRVAGMLTTQNGGITEARIFSDRLGLYRALRKPLAGGSPP
jgi:hypothetical protein